MSLLPVSVPGRVRLVRRPGNDEVGSSKPSLSDCMTSTRQYELWCVTTVNFADFGFALLGSGVDGTYFGVPSTEKRKTKLLHGGSLDGVTGQHSLISWTIYYRRWPTTRLQDICNFHVEVGFL